MTGKLARIAVAATALCLGAYAQTPAPAAAPAAAKIGILNIQAAIANCNEGQKELNALDKKMEPKFNELKALQTEIDNLTKQVSTQSDKLNAEAKAALDKQLQTKQTQFQRGREDYQNDVQAQEQEIFGKIYPKLAQTIDTYASANGYTLVLDWGVLQQGLAWAAKGSDITQAVIDAYNKASGVEAPPAKPAAKPAAPGASRPAPK